ncbi:hypothetical protein [Roseovarius indicus]|uniref:hypothetical protein n=1 Tax=Roseovarius indicus TaxID=540747 RepID=UPI0032EDAF9C
MARRFSYARIKSHRNYEIEELAECVGVTPQTVRTWIKEGLPAITDKRPFLIVGNPAKAFLKEREAARKVKRGQGEFYCVRCKQPRKAALGLTETATMANGRRVLKGFCDVCETPCSRFLPASDAA